MTIYNNQEPENSPQEQAPEAPQQEEEVTEQSRVGEQQQYAQQAEPGQDAGQVPPQYTYQAQQVPPNQGYVPPPGQYPYRPPVQQSNNKKYWWLAAGLGGGCLLLAILGLFILFGIGVIAGGAGEPFGEHVALIHVNGVITAGKSSGGPFSSSTSGSEDLVAQLESVRKNDDAKAVVIRINSPGGSPSGSEEVYNAIRRVRDDGIPVYISMGDVAASGGYYIAAAADKIYADASTLTGSIGVIFQTTDMSELYDKIGFNPQTVKSGQFKDIGSSARPLTPAERSLLQGIVNDTYEQFVQAVAKGRKMKVADVKAIADGRVFTGNQALKLKLVDNIGGLHETVNDAAKAGGISGEPEVKEYGDKGLFGTLFGSESESSFDGVDEAVTRKLLERLLSQEGSAGGLR